MDGFHQEDGIFHRGLREDSMPQIKDMTGAISRGLQNLPDVGLDHPA
jgi:hypothetical protein